MDLDQLYQVVYVSKSRGAITEADLNQIRQAAAVHNHPSGVTGLLLVGGGYFLQLLEGSRRDVAATLGRVAMDQRHEKLTVLYAQASDQRYAGSWNMGVLDTQSASLALDVRELAREIEMNMPQSQGMSPGEALARAFEACVSKLAG